MVYRALGDVDRALDLVAPDDSAAALKTIEAFAVECSINKVWTSETLAYAVDEAVQVFGGNGYSREFPVERAYRDARITRIYEGTNEINRLIIPTRLIKQSGALFTAASARRLLAERDEKPSPEPLAVERGLLAGAKRLAVSALGYTVEAYGDGLRDQQEILGHTADVVIEIYAIESAIARADKLLARRVTDRSSVALDMARIYASDAMDRVIHSARQVVAALVARGADTIGLPDLTARLAARPPVDTVAARRRVADAVIQAGSYPF
jgi:alkylation response protein AidB-like acyl-CoA dehydrogenase